MKTIEIKVENLKCHGCASTITKGLMKRSDVLEVKVDVENSTVIVTFTGEEITEIKKKLAALGYPEMGHNDTISVVKSYVSCAVGRINS